jgi:hypothetical protein
MSKDLHSRILLISSDLKRVYFIYADVIGLDSVPEPESYFLSTEEADNLHSKNEYDLYIDYKNLEFIFQELVDNMGELSESETDIPRNHYKTLSTLKRHLTKSKKA